MSTNKQQHYSSKFFINRFCINKVIYVKSYDKSRYKNSKKPSAFGPNSKIFKLDNQFSDAFDKSIIKPIEDIGPKIFDNIQKTKKTRLFDNYIYSNYKSELSDNETCPIKITSSILQKILNQKDEKYLLCYLISSFMGRAPYDRILELTFGWDNKLAIANNEESTVLRIALLTDILKNCKISLLKNNFSDHEPFILTDYAFICFFDEKKKVEDIKSIKHRFDLIIRNQGYIYFPISSEYCLKFQYTDDIEERKWLYLYEKNVNKEKILEINTTLVKNSRIFIASENKDQIDRYYKKYMRHSIKNNDNIKMIYNNHKNL